MIEIFKITILVLLSSGLLGLNNLIWSLTKLVRMEISKRLIDETQEK